MKIFYKTAFLFFLLCKPAFTLDLQALAEGKSPSEAAAEIEKAAAGLEGEEHKAALVAAADLLMLAGDIERAGNLYEKASLAVKGGKDFYALYNSAAAAVESGFNDRAEAMIRAITTFSTDSDLRMKAALLGSRVNALDGKTGQAVTAAVQLAESGYAGPELVLWLNELAEASGSDELSTLAGGLLAARGSGGSADNGKWFSSPNPEKVFGLISAQETEAVTAGADVNNSQAALPEDPPEDGESPLLISIQAGSFTDPVNAEDLAGSLRKAGFNTEIRPKTVNGKNYNSVLIPDIPESNLQDMIIKLKEAGFEGYPLY